MKIVHWTEVPALVGYIERLTGQEVRVPVREFRQTDVIEVAKVAVTLALREAGCHTKHAETAILAARALKIYLEMSKGEQSHGLDQGETEAGDRKEPAGPGA